MSETTPKLLTEQEAQATLAAVNRAIKAKVEERKQLRDDRDTWLKERAEEIAEVSAEIAGLLGNRRLAEKFVGNFKPRKRTTGKLVAEGEGE